MMAFYSAIQTKNANLAKEHVWSHLFHQNEHNKFHHCILMLFFYLFWDVQQDGDKIWGNTIKAAKEIFITVVLMSCYMVGFFVF